MIPLDLHTIARAVGAAREASWPAVLVRRVTTDSREVQPGDLFVALRGPRFDGHRFLSDAIRAGAVACVGDLTGTTGQSFDRPCLVVDDTLVALGRLAAFYRNSVLPVGTVVIAVTGSNGKTTTKCMIDHVLRSGFKGRPSPKSYNNAIGVPLTLLSADADDRYVVAEIGTNAPGEIAHLAAIASPFVAVITSIGEAHLEGLGDLQAVAAEKASLLRFVRPSGFAVVNVDRAEILPHLAAIDGTRTITVGLDPSAKLRVTRRRADLTGTTFELEGRYQVELPMPGAHHATNAAAAFAVARWFGIPPEQIIERLRDFVPPEGRTHRMEVGGVTLVDDTYNANPSSVAAAIDTLRSASGRRVMVLGDMLELGRNAAEAHARMVRSIVNAGIEVLVAVGPAMTQACETHGATAEATCLHSCENAEAAGALLDELLRAGDTVWIKASRGMELDRVVRHLRTRVDAAAAINAPAMAASAA